MLEMGVRCRFTSGVTRPGSSSVSGIPLRPSVEGPAERLEIARSNTEIEHHEKIQGWCWLTVRGRSTRPTAKSRVAVERNAVGGCSGKVAVSCDTNNV